MGMGVLLIRAKQHGARPAGELLPAWPPPTLRGPPVTLGCPGAIVQGSLQTERAGGGGALRWEPVHAGSYCQVPAALLQAGPAWGPDIWGKWG